MRQSARIAATIAAVLAFSSSASAAGTDPTGIWLDDTGRGAIEIKPCGSGVCGYVVAVKNANDTKGCGKQIIGDAKPANGGTWGNGWIYSPEKRKNYDVELKPLTNGTLRVVGYAGTKLFSRTMIWTQAPADLKRCDNNDSAAPTTNEAGVNSAKATTSVAAAEVPAQQPRVVRSAPVTSGIENPTKTERAEPAPEPTETTPDDETTADSGEQPGERSSGKRLKIGNLELDTILTRTETGKCKLDLPWVKVKFDCER